MALTPQQQRFVDEYLIDLNATQAAIRAGYSKKSAYSVGGDTLKIPEVAAAIEARQKARSARTQVTQDRVLLELARLAFGDLRPLFREDGTLKDPQEWDDESAAVVASVETDEEFRPADVEESCEAQPHGGALKRSRARLVAVRTRKLKRYDKGKALELLCRHLGMLKENAPHPDANQFDLSKIPDDLRRSIATAVRLAALRVVG